MKDLQAVFFDMGSTLSHQDPTREDVISRFLLDRGHPQSLDSIRRALLKSDTWWHLWIEKRPFGWNDDKLRERMRQQYRQTFLETLGLENTDGLRQSLDDLWNTSIMRRHNAIYPDVLPTIAALRERGLKLALVSNWDTSLNSHCDDLGLTPHFDTIVGSFYVGYEKPDPRIFHVALERLSLQASQVLHIGDMYVSDVVGARRAGITPVLLDRDDLQPEAECLRVRTLDQILPLV